MRIRFQADADLDPAIGQGLVRRELAIDWSAAHGLIADGTPDLEVLRLAAAAGRVLVTGDVSTMRLNLRVFTAETSSPGVILVGSKLTIGETINRLRFRWLSWSAEELENQAWWL